MAFLKFLDTSEIEEFATALANDLGRRFPPVSESRKDPAAANQLKIILEGLGARARRFRAQHELGVYKKAKLGNTFRWKLKELGYSDSFCENATRQLVLQLAVK
jgi:hypothetical protein